MKKTSCWSVGGEENLAPKVASAFSKCLRTVLYEDCEDKDIEAAKALAALSWILWGVPGGSAEGASLN